MSSDQRDYPSEGLPIWEALERWAPAELWQRYKEVAQHDHKLFFWFPSMEVDPLEQEAQDLRARIAKSLIERLKSGELIAAGIAMPLRYTSRRRDIPAELWPRLEFTARFDEAVAESLTFAELYIREREPRAQGRAVSLKRRQPVQRSPGRPSIMKEIESEMKRRAADGELEPSLRRETEALAEWGREQFAGAHVPKPASIAKKLRPLYRELRQTKSGINRQTN